VSLLTSARRCLVCLWMSFSFAGGRFHSQAVVFIWGWLFLFAGGRFCSWAVVFVCRGPFSFVGGQPSFASGHFCSQAVVFVRGRSSLFAGAHLRLGGRHGGAKVVGCCLCWVS
jgi:hypothetical protein